LSSHVVVDKALYSAYEDDLDTVCFFFARHEMRDEPKKKQKLDVDLSNQYIPAQSISTYPRIYNFDFLGNNKP